MTAVVGAACDDVGSSLTIERCTFSSFELPSDRWGGGVFNEGTLAVLGSTFVGSEVGRGGAIYNAGTAVISNSTFSGHIAIDSGGAVYNAGTATVVSSTFSGNSAQLGSGAGIHNASGAVLDYANTIVAASCWSAPTRAAPRSGDSRSLGAERSSPSSPREAGAGPSSSSEMAVSSR